MLQNITIKGTNGDRRMPLYFLSEFVGLRLHGHCIENVFRVISECLPVHVGYPHEIVCPFERSNALAMGFQGFPGCLNAFGYEGGDTA